MITAGALAAYLNKLVITSFAKGGKMELADSNVYSTLIRTAIPVVKFGIYVISIKWFICENRCPIFHLSLDRVDTCIS